jgi:hypothetical protein
MRHFGTWSNTLRAADARFETANRLVYQSAGTKSMPTLRRAGADLLVACRARERQVPAPPSVRLVPVLQKAGAACARYAAVANGVRTTRTAVVYGVLSNPLVKALRQARSRLQAALEQAFLGLVRPSPRSSSASATMSHIDPMLGRQASRLVTHPVAVHCWSHSDWLHVDTEAAALSGRAASSRDEGWTPIGGAHIDLDGLICRRLERLATQPHAPPARSFATADAVRILAHESQHAAGDSDEAITECHGLQRVAETARSLGENSTEARRLASLVWAAYALEPPRYRTPRMPQRRTLRPASQQLALALAPRRCTPVHR